MSESWNRQTGTAEHKKKTKQNPYIAGPNIKQFEVRSQAQALGGP